MSFSSGDYYRRLRLPKDASRREIRAAFRRLARQYHPGLHPNKPGAANQFRALREAYEVLIDRVQRQRYDQIQQGYGNPKKFVNPQTPVDFYIRGVRYAIARRYRAALGDFTRALQLDDRFAEAYLRRAEVNFLLEDDPTVLADCQRAIALNSTEAKTYYYQGLARYRMGYVQSAIAAFTDAIVCDPDDARYYYRRGLAYQDLRETDEAAIDLRRAAQLYRDQGDMANHQRLRQYLRQFGTAGRSRPVRFLGGVALRLSQLLPSRHAPTALPAQPRLPERIQGSRHSSPQPPLSPQPPAASDTLAEPSPIRPLKPTRNPQFTRSHWLGDRRSAQTYWVPGQRSRRLPHEPRRGSLLSGFTTVLRLLSNPAGELVPVYQQLSSRQANLVGYGLAVLANLTFVLGTIQYFEQGSWLEASQLWAAGGLTYVAMVLAVAIARLKLPARGLWVAGIFTLGTAVVPLGMLAIAIATIQGQGFASGPASALALDPRIAHVALLLATLWAFSHALIALYSGLSRIQAFSARTAAWLAPGVLAFGLGAGLVTWGILAVGS